MNDLLSGLGVPSELQALFNNSDGIFDFGDSYEHFGRNFHRVPTSQNVWRTAPAAVTDVIITHSAMEAMAYLAINSHLHVSLENVALIAIGNYPHDLQTAWIRQNFRRQKITLAFSNCILGLLADVKVAATIRRLPLRMSVNAFTVVAQCKGMTHTFEQEAFSLHAFEKAFAIRSGIKTKKPKNSLTFLQELLAYGK